MSNIIVFGRVIPVYGLCWVLGISLSALVAIFLIKKRNIEIFDFVCSAVFAVLSGFAGAKLLFIVVSIGDIVKYSIPFEAVLKGGFVFYGGLLGGAVGLYVYTRIYKLSAKDYFDIYAAVLPLGHAVGRVGCHFAGCCYGVKYDGIFSVTYTNSDTITPLNTPLFPIQLTEAFVLCILFIFLMIIFNKSGKKGATSVCYLYGYAVMRFVLEFLRGDTVRGILFGLSTSQIISLLIIAVMTAMLLRRCRSSKFM